MKAALVATLIATVAGTAAWTLGWAQLLWPAHPFWADLFLTLAVYVMIKLTWPSVEGKRA